jgi:hypothetical protein
VLILMAVTPGQFVQLGLSGLSVAVVLVAFVLRRRAEAGTP